MSEQVSYQEIHAFMLSKTKEYYEHPPAELILAAAARCAAAGEILSREEAAKRVPLIEIQRYIRREMTEKWPEFMKTIPRNSLQDN